MANTTWDEARAQARIDEHAHLAGAMLPMLHALMEEFGYVDERAVSLLARAVNVSRAEVVGVINFYPDFRQSPPGRHVLRVCRAEACQSMGCEPLVEHLESRLSTPVGGTSPDGAVTLEAVYCLGNCALSPAVLFDGRLHGRVSAQRVDQLLEEAAR